MDDLMNQIRRPVLHLALLIILALVLPAQEAEARKRGSHSRHPARAHMNEFVFEGSVLIPGNEISGDYWTTDHGLGAENGWEIGGRIRHYLNQNLAISPAFHYKEFGDFSDVGDFEGVGDGLGMVIQTKIYRYGLDFQQFLSPAHATARPYVTAGIALCHNTYRDWIETEGYFKTTTSGVGVGIGFGVKMSAIEISGVYNINRFETRKLPSVSEDNDYNWDNIVIRIGISPTWY